RDSIDIVVAQGLRRILRHGATDIIEQGWCVRPVAPNGFRRPWRRKRTLPADQSIAETALTLRAMAGRALLIKDLVAVTDAAASRRKVIAVTIDVDIPAGDFRRSRHAPDAVRTLRLRVRCDCQRKSTKDRDINLTRSHWSPRR